MKLEIHSVEDKGKLDSERIWLKVKEGADLAYYQVADTTYYDNGTMSNELRHLFWFPATTVKAGDWVCLYTKNGSNTKSTNKDNSTSYTFYWKLGRTIWNIGRDQAVLFELNTWTSKAV
jgi:hypothetical protein